MTKIFFCLRRRPDLSAVEFFKHWSRSHGPLVVKLAPQTGLKRYIQNWAVASPMADAGRVFRGTAVAFDGVAEAWIDESERQRLMDAESGRALFEKIFADELKFIDMETSVYFAVEEHVLIEGFAIPANAKH
jgi:EthD domain